MPICFQADPPQGGCPERIVVSGPFFVVDPNTGRYYIDPARKQLVPDGQAAWAFVQQWCQQQQIPLAQSQYKPFFIADNTGQKTVVAIQFTPMATQNYAPVTAPYNYPTGNGQQLTMPPELVPQNQIQHDPNNLDMQEIHDSALPRNSDPLMGEIDPSGGTWSDYDPLTKREEVRTLKRPYGINPQGGGR